IYSISVSPPLFVLSDSALVPASPGDGESRTILVDVSSCGCVDGPVDASSVAKVHLWNMNWSMEHLLSGVYRASRDWAACSSVMMALPFPSTTGSGQMASIIGS
ncbi:hypothetical protein Tco_0480023, partial [Tanacetum coccineum]